MKIQAKKNKVNAGYIELKRLTHNGHVEIVYLSVKKEFRNLGIGTKLVERAKKAFPISTLVAFIEPHPDSPITKEQEEKWLMKLGFVKENYYDFGDSKKPVMIFKTNT